jgi:hypothetical protein
MQLSDPRWGTALKIPKLMRREITAGVSEYHIIHWNLGLAKGLLSFGKLCYMATARNSASSSLAARE